MSIQKNDNYVTYSENNFSILPKQGTLERDDTRTFEIIFNPDKVKNFNLQKKENFFFFYLRLAVLRVWLT